MKWKYKSKWSYICTENELKVNLKNIINNIYHYILGHNFKSWTQVWYKCKCVAVCLPKNGKCVEELIYQNIWCMFVFGEATCVCVYIYIYIYTHTHTQTFSN